MTFGCQFSLLADARYELKVTRNNFFPPPKVMSITFMYSKLMCFQSGFWAYVHSYVKVDAAIVSFRIKQPTEYPSVLSDKSFFTLVSHFSSMKIKPQFLILFPHTLSQRFKCNGLWFSSFMFGKMYNVWFLVQVNSAFSGKRKMLRKSLQHLYPCTEIQEALRSLDLLETVSPFLLLFFVLLLVLMEWLNKC
mgnify:CR=1 FL=1